MREIFLICRLFRYCRPSEWPGVLEFLLFKALRRPRRINLKLRGQQWSVVTTQPSGVHFFNEVVIHESYGAIRPDLLALAQPVVIDCGANCGAFALWVLSVNPGARVFSYEPGEAAEHLQINRDLYVREHGDYWIVEKCALSSKVGQGFFTQSANSSMGRLEEGGGSQPVPIRTMDDLNLGAQVIKIDVEGHELEVLKGGESALATARLVVLEYHSPELRRQCLDFLSARHFVIEEEGHLLIGRKSESNG